MRAAAGLDYRHGWDARDVHEYARCSGLESRAGAVLSILAELGVRSLLEVGSGPGFLTRAARERLGIPAIVTDVAAAFDASHSGKAVVAEGQALPFRARTFDVVLASEVLEHLDLPTLRATASEMLRVAARHVIVTVPHLEPLEHELVTCRECRSSFNTSGHLRSVGPDLVRESFGRTPTRTQPIGTDRGPPPWSGPLLVALRWNLSPSWEAGDFRCPLCKAVSRLDTPASSLRAHAYLRTRSLLARFGSTRPGKMLYLIDK